MPAGRPRKYQTPEEMQAAIDRYFKDCEKRQAPFTISGLAVALDLTRENILHYEKDENRKEFHDTVKKAKAIILARQEEMLVNGKSNPAGLIFSMKNNYGWKDKQEHELTGKDGAPLQAQLSDEELDARIERLLAAKEGAT